MGGGRGGDIARVESAFGITVCVWSAGGPVSYSCLLFLLHISFYDYDFMYVPVLLFKGIFSSYLNVLCGHASMFDYVVQVFSYV